VNPFFDDNRLREMLLVNAEPEWYHLLVSVKVKTTGFSRLSFRYYFFRSSKRLNRLLQGSIETMDYARSQIYGYKIREAIFRHLMLMDAVPQAATETVIVIYMTGVWTDPQASSDSVYCSTL